MPHLTMADGVRLYYEETGPRHTDRIRARICGRLSHLGATACFFSRSHRCITFSQRGYPPSDIPEKPDMYSQDIARDDVRCWCVDALKIDKAHIVGHSMGAYTTLHVGLNRPQRCLPITAAGCGWGSSLDAGAA